MLIGLSDFKAQREKGYYVDKTEIIDELVERIDSSTGVIINRPRRFGKSLMLSMIDYFFNEKRDSRNLFDGLSVSSSPAMCHINAYPVILLSFKDAASGKQSTVVPELKKAIASIYGEFQDDLFPSLESKERKYYDAILSMKADESDYSSSLLCLCRYIEQVKGRKPIVLIDEYDAPIERVFDSPYYEETVSFLKSLFIAAFKDVTSFSFALLTGVFGIAKGTLGSGLNNIPSDNVITSVFRKNYFGFDEEDMKRICKDFHIDEGELPTLKEYYGGYRFPKQEVYNPWSILNYVSSFDYATYWVNSGSNSTFAKVLNKSDIFPIDFLLGLLQDGRTTHLDPSSSYDTIYASQPSGILYLAMAGYFSVEKCGFSEYRVFAPNLETRYAFLEEIKKKYKDQEGLSQISAIRSSLLRGDASALSSTIKDTLLSALSYYDFSDEKNYQIMVGTMLALACGDCRTKFEVIAGTGRCDIMVYNRQQGHFGAVIEIKYHAKPISSARLLSSAENALKQIERKEYVDELQIHSADPIYAYGFAFMKNKVAIKAKRIK